MDICLECGDPNVAVELQVFELRAPGGRPVRVSSVIGQPERWRIAGQVDHRGSTDFTTGFDGYRTGLSAAVELAVELSKALSDVERSHEAVRSAREAVRRRARAVSELMERNEHNG
jgi:hypothetical protein